MLMLDEKELGPDPVEVFREWYAQAEKAGVPQWDAMALATADAQGRPSARMVLLKQADQNGFVFYTNYESRKGRDLRDNAARALVFYWAPLNRSVRVEGAVVQVSAGESDAYFAGRPRDGQLSSVTSAQSTPVGSREALDRRYEEMREKFEGKEIPRPSHWGGYRVIPDRIEFWQQRFAAPERPGGVPPQSRRDMEKIPPSALRRFTTKTPRHQGERKNQGGSVYGCGRPRTQKRLQYPHVLDVFVHVLALLRLEDFRHTGEPRIVHEEPEPLKSDPSFADVIVPVHT